MPIPDQYLSDAEAVLSHRYDQGADLWTTPDRRIIKGGPFSTTECIGYLLELGMDRDEPVLRQAADLIWSTWQQDGRFKVYPNGGIYPCQSAIVASTLCNLGFAGDARMQRTFAHFLETQYHDGGWRCNKFFFGRGPETEHANPLPTLNILDAFRYQKGYEQIGALDQAITFLLWHWTVKKPVGPCHYGIGTLFMQVEYPFRGYDLFYYVYVLSFYAQARRDPRFLEALAALTAKTQDGQIIVERVVPKLAKLNFCKKGEKSELATKRYREILANVALGSQ